MARLRACTMVQTIAFWSDFERMQKAKGRSASAVRLLCRADLFYLLVRACGRKDMLHPWIYERVREVEAAPDGFLDLWARGHYKSSIITFGLTISNILNDPELTFGIFSHTRPIAKAFLRQIMREFENNLVLRSAFPDILWGRDLKEAPKWSEDDGLIVRRRGNPNEATIEAWGLIDGQPTSKHFRVLIYDDVVTQASINTPEMMEKTVTALEQSYNLAAEDAVRRFIGTRWHFNDAYRTLLERGSARLRAHPGRSGGEEQAASVYWSEEVHREKRRDMGPYTYACLPGGAPILMAQWLEKPIAAVRPGEVVIGWVCARRARPRLRPARVLAVHQRRAEVFEYTLASGRSVRCSADHNWYAGARRYAPLAPGPARAAGRLSRLICLYHPRALPARRGALTGALRRGETDRAIDRRSLGFQAVYSIETETGNYIAYGYASKNSQVLLNPKAEALQGFRREWLRHYREIRPAQWAKMSRYLLVDAANAKKKSSDYTAIGVVGLGLDRKFYLLDGVRDRLTLTERTARLIDLHRKWKIRHPVRYERYGLAADIDHVRAEQEKQNYRFELVEVAGITRKIDRIGRLIPVFEQGDFYLPEHLWMTDYCKTVVDLVRVFIEEEYAAFPVGLHDDFLDMLARILEPELKLIWPREDAAPAEPARRSARGASATAWMA